MIRKSWRFLTSFKLAILLFILIALWSIIGIVLPQGVGTDFYLGKYKIIGNIIILLQLNQIYSSLLFKALLIVFTVNLTGCTLNILPYQISRIKKDFFLTPKLTSENLWDDSINLKLFKNSLEKKGYRTKETEKGFKAGKHRIGSIGSSITHLGTVIIILGGFMGNAFTEAGKIGLCPSSFGYYFVVSGSLLLLLGLLLSFYFYPKYVIVEDKTIYPVTRQNSWGFNIEIKKILRASKKANGEDL